MSKSTPPTVTFNSRDKEEFAAKISEALNRLFSSYYIGNIVGPWLGEDGLLHVDPDSQKYVKLYNDKGELLFSEGFLEDIEGVKSSDAGFQEFRRMVKDGVIDLEKFKKFYKSDSTKLNRASLKRYIKLATGYNCLWEINALCQGKSLGSEEVVATGDEKFEALKGRVEHFIVFNQGKLGQDSQGLDAIVKSFKSSVESLKSAIKDGKKKPSQEDIQSSPFTMSARSSFRAIMMPLTKDLLNQIDSMLPKGWEDVMRKGVLGKCFHVDHIRGSELIDEFLCGRFEGGDSKKFFEYRFEAGDLYRLAAENVAFSSDDETPVKKVKLDFLRLCEAYKIISYYRGLRLGNTTFSATDFNAYVKSSFVRLGLSEIDFLSAVDCVNFMKNDAVRLLKGMRTSQNLDDHFRNLMEYKSAVQGRANEYNRFFKACGDAIRSFDDLKLLFPHHSKDSIPVFSFDVEGGDGLSESANVMIKSGSQLEDCPITLNVVVDGRVEMSLLPAKGAGLRKYRDAASVFKDSIIAKMKEAVYSGELGAALDEMLSIKSKMEKVLREAGGVKKNDGKDRIVPSEKLFSGAGFRYKATPQFIAGQLCLKIAGVTGTSQARISTKRDSLIEKFDVFGNDTTPSEGLIATTDFLKSDGEIYVSSVQPGFEERMVSVDSVFSGLAIPNPKYVEDGVYPEQITVSDLLEECESHEIETTKKRLLRDYGDQVALKVASYFEGGIFDAKHLKRFTALNKRGDSSDFYVKEDRFVEVDGVVRSLRDWAEVYTDKLVAECSAKGIEDEVSKAASEKSCQEYSDYLTKVIEELGVPIDAKNIAEFVDRKIIGTALSNAVTQSEMRKGGSVAGVVERAVESSLAKSIDGKVGQDGELRDPAALTPEDRGDGYIMVNGDGELEDQSLDAFQHKLALDLVSKGDVSSTQRPEFANDGGYLDVESSGTSSGASSVGASVVSSRVSSPEPITVEPYNAELATIVDAASLEVANDPGKVVELADSGSESTPPTVASVESSHGNVSLAQDSEPGRSPSPEAVLALNEGEKLFGADK